jgi:alpha-beta hydrolase superfamily lysophospholipase
MKTIEDHFMGTDSCKLYYKIWEPEGASLKGVVVIVHGAGEHVGRYHRLVDGLVPAGYVLAGFDLRGHGRSEGQRGHIDSWEDYRSDLKLFIELVGKPFPHLPIFVYGHSLGALIVQDFLITHQEGLAGAVFSGTPIVPTKIAPAHQVLLVKILSGLLPRASLNMHVEGSDLSRDGKVAAAYDQDPLVHWKRTFRWGREGLRTIERVKEGTPKITLPVLYLHGGEDRSVSPEGSQYCYDHVKSEDKQLEIYPGSYHEPHNDLDYHLVVDDIINWLDAHIHQVGQFLKK